ncbi:MAG: Flp pilus assembly complex ATPase component TadA [Myxococcales bacterium]|nr:Flp pilus assembly complex ATPase component TadA [Myxococcales bacterium]
MAERAQISLPEMEEVLRGTILLRGSDPMLATKIARVCEPLAFAARSTMVAAGSPGDALYILARGRAVIAAVNAATGETQAVEKVQAGDLFGEVGPLLRAAQPFSVSAEEACVALRLPADALDTLCQRLPALAHALAKRLAMRLVHLGVAAARGGGRAPGPSLAPAPPREVASPAPRAVGDVIPFVAVADFEPTPKVVNMVPLRLVQQHRLLPLRLVGQRLTIGMVAPRSPAALTELRNVLQTLDFEVVAIALDDFADALARLKIDGPVARGPEGGARGKAGVNPDTLGFEAVEQVEADKAGRVVGDEVVRALNRIIAAGLEREASDIHVEPEAAQVRVRFRQQGVLRDWTEFLPASFARGIASRVKVVSGLDPTERRLPQDGRIGITVGTREVDLRVSVMPSSRGEKVVMRVLEAASMMRPLERVFVDANTLVTARNALARAYGAIIVAGATGSGKSSTLYAMLNDRRKSRPDTNTIMVEDPVEYRLQGVTQVQVNHGVGLGFPQVLRAMLRQDPDVIAIGEMRDHETASIALEAAMTGHLVLSSLHGNTAIAVLQRLENLGCPRALIGQAVALVLVQRLVRRLCPDCCKVQPPAPAVLEGLLARGLVERGANVQVPHPVGCDACRQTGYAGRVVVFESLQVTNDVRDAILSDASLGEIEKLALANKVLTPFRQYATYLMVTRHIGASEALLTVAL